jgi:hypothetical protein
VRAGTRSSDLRAWKPFPVTVSDKDAGRSHQPNVGHANLKVAVENSWPCMTGGPSGRDDLSTSRRDLLAVAQSTRSHAGQAAHHRAMKRYEQPIKMAPHWLMRVWSGRLKPRTLSVVDRRSNCAPARRRKARCGRSAFVHFRVNRKIFAIFARRCRSNTSALPDVHCTVELSCVIAIGQKADDRTETRREAPGRSFLRLHEDGLFPGFSQT